MPPLAHSTKTEAFPRRPLTNYQASTGRRSV